MVLKHSPDGFADTGTTAVPVRQPFTVPEGYDQPVSVFCSFADRFETFRSTATTVRKDLEAQLEKLGVSQKARGSAQSIFEGQRTFSDGLRLEESVDGGKVTVYISLYIKLIEDAIQAGKEKSSWRR